ncbi:hypothetical protein [uncultured Vagococcus sp.]|uniref:hypothetical protein n=1 Tax=uncultured Vagococcus sp. TaxID=189676 RepID=UPI0028D32B31|nr:hypothetical protein [uncultured Vagococcus sp.]
MTFIGLNIAEWAALLAIVSTLFAAMGRLFNQFQQHITAPLVEALNKLRHEIGQLERQLVSEFKRIDANAEALAQRVGRMEKVQSKEGPVPVREENHDNDCRVINEC